MRPIRSTRKPRAIFSICGTTASLPITNCKKEPAPVWSGFLSYTTAAIMQKTISVATVKTEQTLEEMEKSSSVRPRLGAR